MKRPLLTIIFVLEVVAIGVLYYNFRHFYATAYVDVRPQVQRSLEADQIRDESQLSQLIKSLFVSLPVEAAPSGYEVTDDLVVLGRMLFFDARLSRSQTVSCNTCHQLDQYGVDNLPVSVGHNGREASRNAQTVYNAALHVSQFWDGRSPTVEEQSKEPLMSSIEMGMLDSEHVVELLRSIPGYQPVFQNAFPLEAEPISFDNVAIAIGAFERRLLTPSRFDHFLDGDTAQLSQAEQRGLTTFVTIGCTNCHIGVTVGGQFYKKLGEVVPYETDDVGRLRVTGADVDRYVFKVPSLRNVAKTAPYLHDGSIETLEEMVVLMAQHQLGKEVTNNEISDIVAFLHSLTGEIPAAYVEPPSLPPNGPNTPRPQPGP